MNPKPKVGEWYTVMPHENAEIRIVVLIDDQNPNTAIDWHGGMGIANFFEPVLVTKEEARVHLEQEIKNMEDALVNDTEDYEKPLAETILRLNKDFYKKHFPS